MGWRKRENVIKCAKIRKNTEDFESCECAGPILVFLHTNKKNKRKESIEITQSILVF